MSKRKGSPAPGTQEMAIDLEQNDLLPVPIAEEPPKRLRLDDDMVEDQFLVTTAVSSLILLKLPGS